MDDFIKQSIAKEEYQRIKSQIPDPYIGNFESKHIINVENKTIKPTQPEVTEVFLSEYKTDFDKASKDFWQRETQRGLTKYNGGSLTANFGKQNYTLEEFLERLGNFIRESISNELIQNGYKIDELNDNFKAIDINLKLLSQAVGKIDNKVSIENITAFIHGFINTFVTKTIHTKVEMDKGK